MISSAGCSIGYCNKICYPFLRESYPWVLEKARTKQTNQLTYMADNASPPLQTLPSLQAATLGTSCIWIHVINIPHFLLASCSPDFHVPHRMNQPPLCLLLTPFGSVLLPNRPKKNLPTPVAGDIRQQAAITKKSHYSMHLPFLHGIYKEECWQGF